MSRRERLRAILKLQTRAEKKAANQRDWTPVLGLALAVTCAIFPWYIFFNQEQFGVTAMSFDTGGGFGKGARSPGNVTAATPETLARTFEDGLELDYFPTGTTTAPDAEKPETGKQAFPGHVTDFRMVHATLGRAMIEDGQGLYVVSEGSILPDASKVKAIEQRADGWVLVTSKDRVLPLEP